MLLTLILEDPIIWPVGHTTMSLHMQTTPEGNLQSSEVVALLHLVTRAAYAHSPTTIVARTLQFRNPSNPNGPRFAIVPQLLLRDLTWRHVSKIVEALLEYYREQRIYPQLAFQIHDSARGIMGSGMLRQGV